jgi:hypothetical protein
MSYIAGIELGDALAFLAANDVLPDLARELLAACEQGFVTVMNQKEDKDDGAQD